MQTQTGDVLSFWGLARSDHEPVHIKTTMSIAQNTSKPPRRNMPWGTRQLRDEQEIASLLENYEAKSMDPIAEIAEIAVAMTKPGAEVRPSAKAERSDCCAGPH